MTGTLTVGVVIGVTPDKWVRVWRERMPDAALRIVPVDGDPVAALEDVAMVFARLPLPDEALQDLHVVPLWEETPMVLAAKDHPVKAFDSVVLADLAGEQHHAGWAEDVLDMVAAGHGITIVPQSVFRATGRRDLVARPVSDASPTRIALVWRRDRQGTLIDEFVGVVRGRTANSSRGAAEAPVQPAKRDPEPARPKTARTPATRSSRRPGRPSGRRRG